MKFEQNKMNYRSIFIGAIFILLFFGMVYRFYTLQVVEASRYQEEAERMWNRQSTLHAERGSIFDRDGKTLAQEAQAYIVVAVLSKSAPQYIEDPYQAAELLAPILSMDVEQLIQLLSQDGKYQVEIRTPGSWKVDQVTMEQIVDLEIPGIIFIEEAKRYYPHHNFASHVIGFMNHDNQPVMGLEASLHQSLQGEKGEITFLKDANQARLPNGTKGFIPPSHGNNVYLTLDQQIQFYVEQALDEVFEEYNPDGITVIASRPQTGEILAMANRPAFDPNDYSSITNYMNNSVSSTFEPGSTFKIITLAAAIEEGIYNGNETYQSGTYRLGNSIIRDHNQGVGWGVISFLEGMQRSSNVAFVKLGWERMKREQLYKYIHAFGFGELTGIDLPNESRGFVKPEQGTPNIDIATMTFGQGVAVTAIQQVMAINAIANGGTLYQPYIVDRVINQNNGQVIQQNEPTIIRENVISEKTAQEVAGILEKVVTDGTGQNFYIDGYQSVGKTGTAQKPDPDGGYSKDEFIHSFIGFAPKDEPQIVLYVVVDAPKVEYSLGGAVVAQIYKSIMQNSLQYLSVMPTYEELKLADMAFREPIEIEDYRNMSIMEARQRIDNNQFNLFVFGDGTEVTKQVPAPGSKMYAGESLYLIAGDINSSIVPDFRGWTLRQVYDWTMMANVTLDVVGNGFATEQSVAAGQTIQKNDTLSIIFSSKYESKEEEMEEVLPLEVAPPVEEKEELEAAG